MNCMIGATTVFAGHSLRAGLATSAEEGNQLRNRLGFFQNLPSKAATERRAGG